MKYRTFLVIAYVYKTYERRVLKVYVKRVQFIKNVVKGHCP